MCFTISGWRLSERSNKGQLQMDTLRITESTFNRGVKEGRPTGAVFTQFVRATHQIR